MPKTPGVDTSLTVSVAHVVCHHLDGMAIGSFVGEFLARGVFEKLTGTREAQRVNSLAHEAGARPGYFHVAMRLLAHQRFVRLGGDIPEGETTVTLTDYGQAWAEYADYYKQAPFTAEVSHALMAALASGESAEFNEPRLPRTPPLRREDALPRLVALHLHGWLVAAVMKDFWEKGLFGTLAAGDEVSVSHQDCGAKPPVWKFARDILKSQGWANAGAERLFLTPAGKVAASLAVQYLYPVSYLPVFRSVPQTLFGCGKGVPSTQSGADEAHVDRRLDIKFSGLVFERTCKEPFLDMALPLFDREPVSEQPSCVVDTGSGDGSLLTALYEAVRERTLRGRRLKERPLTLVGVEYDGIALEVTKAALEGLGAPNLTLCGDIGDPAGLSRKLAEHGIDPFDALHVSKSVIHDRRYEQPENTLRAALWQPLSRAPFVSEDGRLISARNLECNLVEFFEKWIPFTGRHGMAVIEAHTVDPIVVSEEFGPNPMSCLDATHGFSHQYLVEYEVFLRAAHTAGYRRRARRLLAGRAPDHTVLAIHHFVPADAINSDMSFNKPTES